MKKGSKQHKEWLVVRKQACMKATAARLKKRQAQKAASGALVVDLTGKSDDDEMEEGQASEAAGHSQGSSSGLKAAALGSRALRSSASKDVTGACLTYKQRMTRKALRELAARQPEKTQPVPPLPLPDEPGRQQEVLPWVEQVLQGLADKQPVQQQAVPPGTLLQDTPSQEAGISERSRAANSHPNSRALEQMTPVVNACYHCVNLKLCTDVACLCRRPLNPSFSLITYVRLSTCKLRSIFAYC